MYPHCLWGSCVGLFWYAFLCVLHLDEKERAGCFALIVLCLVTVNVMWLLLTLPWVFLQCLIVVFTDQLTYFLKLNQLRGDDNEINR